MPESASNQCTYHFVGGAFFEVTGSLEEEYLVQLVDTANQEVVHQGLIRNNHWIRTARRYFTKWQINVFRTRDNAVVFSHLYECKGKRVYIAIESRALGDTLAWFPAVDEFRKKHDCQVICSSFLNELFRDEYPEIEFVEPGTTVHNLYAMYRLGWFYREDGEIDYHQNIGNFRKQPLSESAFDILGLPYTEIRPRIREVNLPRPIEGNYVCIAVHATAQAKYWNNATGWSEVMEFIADKGYEIFLLSKEGLEYMGNRAPKSVTVIPEGPLENLIHYLRHAKMFIGTGSGISWLAWAVGCRTCIISGFSLPYTEVKDCIRIFPEGAICTGCFNRYRLNAGDWNWCPDHKDSPRMFECTKNITGQQVIKAIKDYLC